MHIIAGNYKNRILSTPKGNQTRPTSSRLREALFNICQGSIVNTSFLDLFAGSGAIGLEALSRGASKAVLVDSSKECGRCISKNVDSLKVQSQATVLCNDVFAAIKKLSSSGNAFDIIYADPPYEMMGTFNGQVLPYSQQVLSLIDTLPLLKVGGYLYIEDVFTPEQLGEVPTLKLISKRRIGSTHLCEFQKIRF
jgi:16S rRNA (guanine966-N2)-methyltransferase